MLNTLYRRRTIRQFTNQAVPTGVIEELLRAALTSPSSMGRQSPEFVVVEDVALIRRLQDCKQHSAVPLETAMLAIAVIADTTLVDVWVEDAAIAAFAIQVAAEAHGLGSTWIQLRKRLSVEGEDAEKTARRMLHIPEHYAVLCLLAIGHKAESKPPHTDEEMNWARVHREKYTVRVE